MRLYYKVELCATGKASKTDTTGKRELGWAIPNYIPLISTEQPFCFG